VRKSKLRETVMKTTVISLALVLALTSAVCGGQTSKQVAVVLPGGVTAAVVPGEEVKDVTVGDYGWVCVLAQEEQIYYCNQTCDNWFAMLWERWACVPGEESDYCDESLMEILRLAPCILDPYYDCTIGEWTYAYDYACG
jgi:hypothetical protein